jgi:hypothetical protein
MMGLILDVDDLLIRARDMAAFRKPSHGDYKSVKQWFFDNKPLLEAAGEAEFISWKEDMVSLHQGREWAAFDEILITVLRWLNVGFIQVRLVRSFWSQQQELMDRRTSSGLPNCEKRKERIVVSSSTLLNA